jgi:DNA-binding transcriptional regulator YhcF (GntR family)
MPKSDFKEYEDLEEEAYVEQSKSKSKFKRKVKKSWNQIKESTDKKDSKKKWQKKRRKAHVSNKKGISDM